MAKIKKSNNTKCWQECGARDSHLAGRSVKWYNHLGKNTYFSVSYTGHNIHIQSLVFTQENIKGKSIEKAYRRTFVVVFIIVPTCKSNPKLQKRWTNFDIYL